MFINQDSVKTNTENLPDAVIQESASSVSEVSNPPSTTQNRSRTDSITGIKSDMTVTYQPSNNIVSPDSIAYTDSVTTNDFAIDSTYISSHWWNQILSPNNLSVDSLLLQNHRSNYKISQIRFYEGIKNPFLQKNTNGLFVLLLFCFICFSVISKNIFPLIRGRVLNITKTNFTSELRSESTTHEIWSSALMIFQTIIILSIIVFQFFLEYNSTNSFQAENSTITVLIFCVISVIALILKNIFYTTIGYIFNIQKIIKEWRHNYIAILGLLGIASFIPAIFLVYSHYAHTFFFILIFIFFIIIRLLVFYRIISFFLQQNVNILFLIIYLCSVEILPYIVLFKGLEFIYEMDIISMI